MPFPTPLSALMDVIARFEGEWQDDPNDSGNYVNCNGQRRLVGTMRGVTAAVAARYLGVDPCALTAETMRQSVTLEVAASIGLKGYYDDPGFDGLEWSPLIEIALDIGWGSGPVKGVKMLQQLVGATADGRIGPQTKLLYEAYIRANDIGAAVDKLSKARRDFYIAISPPGDKDHKFQRGWFRRADYYTTRGNGIDADLWWPRWAGWTPSGGSETGKPVAPPVLPARPAPPGSRPEAGATATVSDDDWTSQRESGPSPRRESWIIRLFRALFGESR